MSYLIEELSWFQYKEQIDQNKILIIPIGATEQHGPHLPLGVDAMLATSFARVLAEQIGAVVAPTINYGYKSLPMSGGGPFFPGTIDLNGTTLINLVKDIVVEFARDGKTWRIEALADGADGKLFLVFADRTSGHGSYPAGRFLDVDAPGKDGKVLLDFNRAYNPPCAFTPFATCPLPPPENRLDLEVEAGEKAYVKPASEGHA